MASLFTKIVERKIPAHIVAEDHAHIAFLDILPVQTGHTLVVPKKEVDLIYDLPDEELAALFCFAKKVARGVEQAFSCKRVSFSVIGLEVPHAHIHLIPINEMKDLDFNKKKIASESDTLKTIAQKISAHIQ